MRQINILPYGRFANNLFQYMMAYSVIISVGQVFSLNGNGMKELDIPAHPIDNRKANKSRVDFLIESHYFDYDYICEQIEKIEFSVLNIHKLSTRMYYYEKNLNFYKQRINFHSDEIAKFFGDKLVISIRGDEILKGVHRNYLPVPISFIRKIIDATSLMPVFVGQFGNDYYSRALKKNFPEACFYKSEGYLDDFIAIRSAKEILLSISTFSWLAAWLSDAEKIHFPIMGLYNPLARPDIDMLPFKDSRYHFYDTSILQWGLDIDDSLRELTDGDFDFIKINSNHVMEKYCLI